MRKRGTTLIEIVVALAVGMVAVIIIWGLFRMSHRMFHSTRKRLTSLQGAFMLLDRFALDIGQVINMEKAKLEVTGNRRVINFYSFDEENTKLSGDTPKVAVKKFSYRRDKDTNEFKWKEGSEKEKAFKAAGFETILYTVPAATDPQPPVNERITFRITCAAHDDLEANKGKGDLDKTRRDREVVTLISVIGFHQKASEAAFPWWNHNRLPSIGK